MTSPNTAAVLRSRSSIGVPGEGAEGGVGQSLAQIAGEPEFLPGTTWFIADHKARSEAVLRPMRFVGDDDDVAALGQQRMGAILTTELLDRGEDDPADIDLEQIAHLGRAVGLSRGDAQRRAVRAERPEQLLVEVVAIGLDDDRRVL